MTNFYSVLYKRSKKIAGVLAIVFLNIFCLMNVHASTGTANATNTELITKVSKEQAEPLMLSLAFEGAKGFGRYSQGGKNGKLYIVTSLLDQPDNPLPGTLRHAIKQKHARTVVFAVSGVIKLQAPLKISHGYITIAGQSSPGGITLAGAPVTVSKSEQVILRYLRFRLGTFGYAEDALTVRNSENVIIDHCSMSWSVDETASLYNNRNFTLQNSIISHSLNNSIHPKGKHGYGGIWGGANASFINNIIANHASRTPRINGHRLKAPYPQADEFIELINNTVFNWQHNNVYGSENGRFDLRNNYYKAGAASKIIQFADIWYSPYIKENQAYIAGNVMAGENPIAQQLSKQNWLGINYRNAVKSKRIKSTKDSAWLTEQLLNTSANEDYPSAKSNFTQLIQKQTAGANRNANGVFIDNVDLLVYQQLRDEVKIVKQGLIDHEFELINSWENYEQQFRGFNAIIDQNHDGIDDNWLKNWQKSAQGQQQKNIKPQDLLNIYLAQLAQ